MKNVARWIVLGVGAAMSAGAGCSSKPATQFTLGVISQIQVPADMKTIRITASAGGTRGFCATYPVEDGTARLPQSLALAPGGDPNTPVTVTVIGFQKTKNDVDGTFRDECLIPSVSADPADVDRAQIVRRSKQPYVPAKNLYVPMPLKYSCYGVDCKDGQTCKGGACVDPTVDVTALPAYAPDLLYGNTNTCFDEDLCLNDAVGPTVIDAANCVYEVPPGSSLRDVGMNVRAVFEGGGVEVLDLSPEEGFSIPDASKPNRFQLATGVCHPAPGGRRVANVNASRSCASKNMYQPMCAKTGVHLRPAASALTILMDRDTAMSQYVGPSASPTEAIDKVLSVALGDPVFSTTKVALKLVPNAAPNACTASGYATPDTVPGLTGFAEVWDAAGPIAAFLAGTNTTSTAEVAAGAALKGAASNAIYSGALVHKTLLLVTNRDPTTTACADALGATVSTLAGQKIELWVLSLRKEGESQTDLMNRQNAVKALSAQGATVISAESALTAESQLAVVTGLSNLVGQLGACVYEKPGNVDTGASKVFYTSPVSAPVEVPYASGCQDGASVSGWNVDASTLRICGAACDNLRAAVSLAGKINAQKNASSATAGQQVSVFLRPK